MFGLGTDFLTDIKSKLTGTERVKSVNSQHLLYIDDFTLFFFFGGWISKIMLSCLK